MNYILIIITMMICVALVAVSYWWLQRQINKLKRSPKPQTQSTDHHGRKHISTVVQQNLSKQLESLVTKYEELSQEIKKLKAKYEELSQEIKKLKAEVDDNGHEDVPDKVNAPDEGQPESDTTENDKIWVDKSIEGMMLLYESQDKKDIYLLKDENHYLLHIVDISVEDYWRLTAIYEDVIDFPHKVTKSDELEMSENPIYVKDNSGFRFKEKGRISIKR